MTCPEFRTHLASYVDGELPLAESLTAESHAAGCGSCRALTAREREFRQLLRQQPREVAPAELRARIVAACRDQARRQRRMRVLPWLAVPALAAAATLAIAVLGPWTTRPAPPIAALVDKHIAYAQIARPAEFASSDQRAVEAWFLRQATLQVLVPDYTPAGIRRVGGRIADLGPRKVAYVLYEKGRILLSVFMVPDGALPDAGLTGRRVAHRGHEYRAEELRGHRVVAWRDGEALFGLVSTLDEAALLECADRLRGERAARTRL